MHHNISDRKIFRIQLWAVIAGVILLAAKFGAYFITHSNTVLTDALESIINVVAGGFALYSLYLSSLPKDSNHPYGHGKVEFISAGFEGILIILAGLLIIGKSALNFFEPRALQHMDWGLVIIAASGVVNYLLGMVLQKYGNKHRSPTLTADGEHLKTDAYSSVAVVAGIGLIMVTRLPVLDNVVAILAGCFIIYTGIRLLRKSVGGIMDEADTEVIESIIKLLNDNRKPQWIDVHNLRVIRYGNKLHVDCHVTLPWYFRLEEAHNEIEEMAEIINRAHAQQVEFFIHEDPCITESCKICTIMDCKVRRQPLQYRVEWNIENVITNKKHGLN